MKGLVHFDPAFVQWDDENLIMDNGIIRRVIDLTGNCSLTRSLCALNKEFASPENTGCDCSFFGINSPDRKNADTSWKLNGEICARIIDDPDFDAPHIEVKLSFIEEYQQAEFTRIFRIYRELPAISVQNTLVSGSIPNCYWTSREELSRADERFPESYLESAVDSFALDPDCELQYSVEFRGRTDYCNDLVIRHSAAGNTGKFNGNLMLISRKDSGTSLLILQEAPPSAERRDFEKYDFRCDGKKFHSCCWGVTPGELTCKRSVQSYRTTLIGLDSPENLTPELHRYLAGRFPMEEKEAAILVNPWGCGKFPQLTGEKFLLDEIGAAGDIGAEIYQIDDSWQQGKGLAELAFNNLAVNMDFWKINYNRLPDGFAPLSDAAEKAGVKLGLWCAPSYPRMYRDHQEFAELLLEYHRQYGFATIKIDGVRLQSLEAQENLEKLLLEVRQKSDKKLFFNLDTTNGQRPGYFYFLEYGNIFLENRYCYLNDNQTVAYHPEKTLRNLWHLSHYVRPQTLQIEIPAPDDIPDDRKFEYDPRDYSFDYWCALALFANMLIWTSPSRICAENRAVLKKMTALGKEVRKAVFNSVISPFGSAPDGKSFTGLNSDAGYLLIFREKGCVEKSSVLPYGNASIIAGTGELKGNILTMPQAAWCIIKY